MTTKEQGIEIFKSRFTAEEIPAVLEILQDVSETADFLRIPTPLVATVLTKAGQERLDQIKTKSELVNLVAEAVLTPESAEKIAQITTLVDSGFEEPPQADFRLFTRVDEALAASFPDEEEGIGAAVEAA